jgi:3-oxoacyl-[acyl-carrier protein] reductase
MDLGLAGRACAVTGASRGIGAATARLLCAEGAHVLLVARNEERLRAAAEEANAAGAEADGRAEILRLDITSEDAGERMLATAIEHFGSLDVLVNNAGAAQWRDLDDVPDEDWRGQYELNVMAPLRAMRAAIPPMAERGWGRVVNVCSTAGKRPSAAMPEYSVAKAAELSLSRLFADRHAGGGVLFHAVFLWLVGRRRARQCDLPWTGQIGDVDGAGRSARPVSSNVGRREPQGGSG